MTQPYHLEGMQLCTLNIQIFWGQNLVHSLHHIVWSNIVHDELQHIVLSSSWCCFSYMPSLYLYQSGENQYTQAGCTSIYRCCLYICTHIRRYKSCCKCLYFTQSILVSLHCTFDMLVLIHVNFTKMTCRGCTSEPSSGPGWPSSACRGKLDVQDICAYPFHGSELKDH